LVAHCTSSEPSENRTWILDAVVKLAHDRNHHMNRSDFVRDALNAYLEPIEEEFAEELS